MKYATWQPPKQGGLVPFALAVGTSAPLLVGMVTYAVYLVAGPPVSTWNPPLPVTVLLVMGYATLTAFATRTALAWHPLRVPVAHRLTLVVGAVSGVVTLMLFAVFNVLVLVASLLVDVLL